MHHISLPAIIIDFMAEAVSEPVISTPSTDSGCCYNATEYPLVQNRVNMESPGTVNAILVAPTSSPPPKEFEPPKQRGPPDQPERQQQH